jgi:polyphosphate glucokinase
MIKMLGIDIGGSGIKGAPVNLENGRLIKKRVRIPTPQPATPDAVAGVVKELVREFSWDGPVGCGFPAAVREGVVRTASNIDDSWIGQNVEELFSRKIGQTVTVLNDADAAGLAEMHFGAGQEADGVVLLVTVGTGLGTALFSNKILVPNTELGHLMMRGEPAEYLASDSARERLKLKWKEWRANFLDYCEMLHALFWPELIIVGGGVSKKPDRFMPDAEELKTWPICPMAPARMKNKAGIVGAAMAAYPRVAKEETAR